MQIVQYLCRSQCREHFVIYVYARDRYCHFRDEFYTEIGDLTQQAGQVRISDLNSSQCRYM